MTYESTLEKIHSFEKFGSRLGLERMNTLMELLGNPQEKLRVIHVAGTNGKGSVCRYLYSVLQHNGYKTGLYTSPFLEKFTERIEFNGNEISERDLEIHTEKVLLAVSKMLSMGLESPTEFELITAVAFSYFEEKKVDYLVLEVGLGGTGDSTNVVSKPLVSVITSISYDHMEYLGDTLTKIATEKAGIIKNGVPVIYRIEDNEASKVIEDIAEKNGCLAYDASRAPFKVTSKGIEGYSFTAEILGTKYENLFVQMIGMHQIANAICALTVIEVLRQNGTIKLEFDKIKEGLSKAKQNGRLELIKKDPMIIIDGAHNEAGAESLQAAYNDLFKGKKTIMVVGMLADKKITKIIEKFSLITDEFIATEPENPRKLKAEELCKSIRSSGNKCIEIADAADACSFVQKLNEYEVIIFAGSLYLIGKVRGIIKDEEK